MELKEFISTGIIESYLLGTATQREIDMVHDMVHKYPSLKIEIDAVEEALLTISESYVSHVDDRLKAKILSSLQSSPQKVKDLSIETTKMVPMPISNKKTYLRYGLIASIAFLVASLIGNVFLFNANRKITSEISTLGIQKTEMEQAIAGYKDDINRMNKDFNIITQNSAVLLKGTDVSPQSLATVYWNDQSREVYLLVKDLPPPPGDMQYQLWAIVDGQPVDAGVFDAGKGNILQMMKSASGPQAFAVTLEKKGGSPTPTLEAMYLIGEV